MVDQYETSKKADDFELFKRNFPVYDHIELPSIKKLLNNDLTGKRVIDLACGSGDSTRVLADLNPTELVGVDLSPAMIERAQKVFSSSSNPNYAKMKFYAKNCMEPLGLGQFDVVFSVHLLNYAYVKEDLLKFYQNMFDTTKDGGICCGLFNSPFVGVDDLKPGLYKKYGTNYRRHPDNINQDVEFFYGDQHLFTVKGCVWPSSYHEECAQKSGFKSFEWILLTLDTNYNDTEGYFNTYLATNPTVMFKLTK
jgi:SAM-dependent methyltransferase